jgi:flagellar hook-associated protein 3 FlgL
MLNLSKNLGQLQDAQDRLSSGRQVRKLSDDPTAVGSAVQVRSSIGRSAQYIRNVDDGLARLATADTALQQIADHLGRIKDLAMQARSGAIDSVERAAVAEEMVQLRAQIIATTNATYLGQPVFGGTTSSGLAYDSTGSYLGDSATIERNVAPGVRVAVNLNGSTVFSTGVVSLHDAVQDLIDSVTSDPSTIGDNADVLDDHISTLQFGLSEVGGRVNRLEALKSHTDESIASMQQHLSSIEDIDLERAMIDLQTREVAYQAALSAIARVIQPSLVDFLR